MSLYQGLLGAQVELAGIHNPVQKLRRIGSITKLFASELVSTLSLAPFAVRALTLYKSLPPVEKYAAENVQPVYIVKDVRYGEAPRSLVDLYVPADAAGRVQEQQRAASGPALRAGAGVPVVVFVHGGVWAAGDKWHYAPMAACLTRLGVLACVVQYTLYPEALVPQLVEEVSAAFDWAMQHAQQYGGDRQQVSLVGHSAGAQLCMMALLQRAQKAHLLSKEQQQQQYSHPQQQRQHPQQQQEPLPEFPQQFVAVTGVYDIAKHYVYEKERGVHELSTMKRAMGGFGGFAAMSPSVLLAQAMQQQAQKQQQDSKHNLKAQVQQQQLVQQQQQIGLGSQQQQQGSQEPVACNFYSSFQLSGESIAHRIGFDRGSPHHAVSESGLQLQSIADMQPVMQFDVEAAQHLPPTVLLSSCTDLTVPWYESAEMYWRLLDCGVPAKHLVYNKVGHGDFVVEWPTRFDFSSSGDEDWGSAAATGNSIDVQLQQQQDAEQDDWMSSSSSHKHGHLQDISSSSSSSAVLERQRQLVFEQLPHYCKDIAAVVMRQQEVNFVQPQQVPWAQHSVPGLDGVAAQPGSTGWAGSDSDGTSVDAELLVQSVELN